MAVRVTIHCSEDFIHNTNIPVVGEIAVDFAHMDHAQTMIAAVHIRIVRMLVQLAVARNSAFASKWLCL